MWDKKETRTKVMHKMNLSQGWDLIKKSEKGGIPLKDDREISMLE